VRGDHGGGDAVALMTVSVAAGQTVTWHGSLAIGSGISLASALGDLAVTVGTAEGCRLKVAGYRLKDERQGVQDGGRGCRGCAGGPGVAEAETRPDPAADGEPAPGPPELPAAAGCAAAEGSSRGPAERVRLDAELEVNTGRVYRAVLIRPGEWAGHGIRCPAEVLRRAAGKFDGWRRSSIRRRASRPARPPDAGTAARRDRACGLGRERAAAAGRHGGRRDRGRLPAGGHRRRERFPPPGGRLAARKGGRPGVPAIG